MSKRAIITFANGMPYEAWVSNLIQSLNGKYAGDVYVYEVKQKFCVRYTATYHMLSNHMHLKCCLIKVMKPFCG